MSRLFNVSASPHIKDPLCTKNIMVEVLIALMPASIFGIYQFGFKSLVIIVTTIVTCLLTEYLYEYCMGIPNTTSDFSAFVTGLLLALNLPASVPLWIPIIGGVFAILIVKQLFGGLGQNFMNPALGARCFLLISFTGRMSNFTVPAVGAVDKWRIVQNGAASIDGISGATPLGAMRIGESVNLFDMFTGSIGGTIGETSVIAILIGAVYLLIRRIISFRIPVAYIGSFALFILIFGGKGFNMPYLAAQLCGGGLMLGAFFMATDYVTSPITPKGKYVYGILLGCLTGVFRVFGEASEGVSYAIIFCNILVPLIEKITIPTPFGKEKHHEK